MYECNSVKNKTVIDYKVMTMTIRGGGLMDYVNPWLDPRLMWDVTCWVGT